MLQLCIRFVRDESAATSIEYALIGSLVAIAIILGVGALGTKLNLMYVGINSKVSAAVSGS